MPPESESIVIRPIGVVRNAVAGAKYGSWEDVTSQLVLRPEYAQALTGIEEFSHVEVVLWFDRSHAPDEPLIHPRDRADLPLVGYLATRTPNRPNPLGITVARLVAREGNVLTVQGLDAFDGTPIVDLKPYIPRPDLVQAARVPDWLRRVNAPGDSGQ